MSRAPRHQFSPPTLITTTEDLAAVCTRLRQHEFVTVDTEFIRERTYWPELCVVQLAGENEVVLIDALAPDLDLTALSDLLADAAVMKVFHAARQDIEIFVLKFGDVPRPLFDTQVAAMVAGFGDQVGYEALVGGLTGGSIDKAHRFSDWAIRPLSPAQIAYAAADVTYLREIYRKLCARLDEDGRLAWVAEEMAILTDPATYRADPSAMWQRLRSRSSSRRYLGMLRAVAAWRELEAQRVNIPRQRVVRDEILLELAATAPTSAEALARTRGLSRGFAEHLQAPAVQCGHIGGRLYGQTLDVVGTGDQPGGDVVLLAFRRQQHLEQRHQRRRGARARTVNRSLGQCIGRHVLRRLDRRQ